MMLRVDDLITLLRTYDPNLLVADIVCAYIDEDGNVRLSDHEPEEHEEE